VGTLVGTFDPAHDDPINNRLRWVEMNVLSSRVSRVLAAGTLVLSAAGVLAATPTSALADEDGYTCAGSGPQSPGVLAGGSYSSVVVKGFCEVSAGVAVVRGDLTVRPGGVLAAAFAHNDRTGHGKSELIVHDDLTVEKGGVAFLGCDAQEFPCRDDPTRSAPIEVHGDITANQALGVVLHHGDIGGDIVVNGGGGGVSCAPTGAFAALFNSPAFTALELSRIGGDVRVSRYDSCWLGLENNHVGGDARFVNNQLADPDAVEIQSNSIRDDLVCFKNSMVWDSGDGPGGLFPRTPAPNTVHGERAGQCVLSSPTSPGGPSGPGPF
jgi:hypothetical protein